MAITGAPPDVMLGGSYSSGPTQGDYHVIVTDAALGRSSKGRPSLTLQLAVKNDPDHAAKEGKPLAKMFQSLPDPEKDDADKLQTMKGMAKRMVFDGFGVPWPKEDKKFDPRILVGKTAWIRLGKKADTDEYNNVLAVAQEREKLPAQKGTPAESVKPSKRR